MIFCVKYLPQLFCQRIHRFLIAIHKIFPIAFVGLIGNIQGNFSVKALYFLDDYPDGVTGLLPKSNINKAAHPAMIDKLKEGDAIRVIVEKLQGLDRKITLDVADQADEGDWKNFMNGDQKSMNPLAEKLKKALDTKDE